MTPPNQHYTKARKIRRNRAGVYTTHTARRMRRRAAYRRVLTHTREIGKDALWGFLFFVTIWAAVITVVVGGLVLFG